MTALPNSLTAFLDANVLYPSEVRSFLMYLGLKRLYRPLWSDAVHEEWISNLLENRPDLSREKLERTRLLMESHASDALVTGYEHRIPSLKLPDPNDRHVLAAAIEGGASVIVTMNLRDFPPDVLAPVRITAMHPDAFARVLLTRSEETVLEAAEDHRDGMRNPPRTVAEYLAILEGQGLVETVAILRNALL